MKEIQYDNQIVRWWVIGAIVWGLAAMLGGVILAFQLVYPELNMGLPWISFGRLRPVHTNGAIFGFTLSIVFATFYYAIPRLLKTPMFLQQGIMILFQTFFLGTGLGQYLYYQSSYPSPYPYFFLQPVHNIFMLYFIQTGIITTIFTSYCGLWFIRRYYKSIWYIFLVILATGLFDHYWLTLQQNMLVMGVIFGYATHLIDRRVIEQKIS
jgi:cbb3-type cytochrome oxidase subunit 1